MHTFVRSFIKLTYHHAIFLFIRNSHNNTITIYFNTLFLPSSILQAYLFYKSDIYLILYYKFTRNFSQLPEIFIKILYHMKHIVKLQEFLNQYRPTGNNINRIQRIDFNYLLLFTNQFYMLNYIFYYSTYY